MQQTDTLFPLSKDSWGSVKGIIEHYAQEQDALRPFAGPGHWNDPDQLIIGDFGLSLDQQKAQMAMWAIYAAVGTDIPIQIWSSILLIVLSHITIFSLY